MFPKDLSIIRYLPPPHELAASTVVAKLKEWNCNKIFLATEDKNVAEIFKSIFQEMCVTIEKDWIDFVPGKAVSSFHTDRADDYFLKGKEYLTEMVLASLCNSFVTARCSGSAGVMVLAEDFENVYAFNLGRYGIISLD